MVGINIEYRIKKNNHCQHLKKINEFCTHFISPLESICTQLVCMFSNSVITFINASTGIQISNNCYNPWSEIINCLLYYYFNKSYRPRIGNKYFWAGLDPPPVVAINCFKVKWCLLCYAILTQIVFLSTYNSDTTCLPFTNTLTLKRSIDFTIRSTWRSRRIARGNSAIRLGRALLKSVDMALAKKWSFTHDKQHAY